MSHNISNPTVILLPKFKKSPTGRKYQGGTNVLIRVGPNLVASGELGGKYNEAQALAEFKRGNAKLKVQPNMQPVADAIRKL